MKGTKRLTQIRWLLVLAPTLLAGLTACGKKHDAAVANAGGGAAVQRNVITIKGASQ